MKVRVSDPSILSGSGGKPICLKCRKTNVTIVKERVSDTSVLSDDSIEKLSWQSTRKRILLELKIAYLVEA